MSMPLTAVVNMSLFAESGGALACKDFPVAGSFHSTRGFVVPSSMTSTMPNTSTLSAVKTIKPEPVHKARVVEQTPAINVGWTGLKAISDAIGSTGVIGRPPQDTISSEAGSVGKIQLCCTAHPTPAMRRLVKSVIRGLKACQEPEKAIDGMGGTYFFTNDSGRKVGILKPCDEEPLAPNNPKGYVGRQLGDPGWKPTVRVGEAAIREVAAYLLDHDSFARVPTTVLVRARHTVFHYSNSSGGKGSEGAALNKMDTGIAAPEGGDDLNLQPMKLGSLQEFVQHKCDTSEMGSSRFSARDIQRIGILDIRLFNTDRHAGNMLVRLPQASASAACLQRSPLEASHELIPIDHGFCLPEALESPYLEWLHWPQARMPFGEEELAYIRGLDIQADLDLLRRELPMLRPECLRLLEVTTMLLKRCAAAGLTLAEIGAVISSDISYDGEDQPSQLERLCAAAREDALEAEYLEEEANLEAGGGSKGSASDCEDAGSEDESVPGHFSPSTSNEQLHSTPTMESVLEDEELLFGLMGPESPASQHGRAPYSPTSIFSLESQSSLELSFSSDSLDSPPSASRPPLASPFCSPLFASSQPISILPPSSPLHLTPPNPLARSVQDTGFMWRAAPTPIPRRRTHQSTLRIATAYPPPVVPRNTDPSSNPFSDLTASQWQRFLDAFSVGLDELLRSGAWRDTPEPVSMVASSCPRF